jgi:quercetin dioxygenase-like cupin family protein
MDASRGRAVTVVGALAIAGWAVAREPVGSTAEIHAMTAGNVGQLKWGPGPAGLPSGAELALIEGDPTAEGELFTVRLRVPPGYTVAPHWHPTTEVVTVLSGSLSVGDGDRIDPAHDTTLKVGGFASMPAGHHHYAIAGPRGAEFQVHAIGPFVITYVNPADDPRTSRSAGVR